MGLLLGNEIRCFWMRIKRGSYLRRKEGAKYQRRWVYFWRYARYFFPRNSKTKAIFLFWDFSDAMKVPLVSCLFALSACQWNRGFNFRFPKGGKSRVCWHIFYARILQWISSHGKIVGEKNVFKCYEKGRENEKGIKSLQRCSKEKIFNWNGKYWSLKKFCMCFLFKLGIVRIWCHENILKCVPVVFKLHF